LAAVKLAVCAKDPVHAKINNIKMVVFRLKILIKAILGSFLKVVIT
jgi:hypothetical protein